MRETLVAKSSAINVILFAIIHQIIYDIYCERFHFSCNKKSHRYSYDIDIYIIYRIQAGKYYVHICFSDTSTTAMHTSTLFTTKPTIQNLNFAVSYKNLNIGKLWV